YGEIQEVNRRVRQRTAPKEGHVFSGEDRRDSGGQQNEQRHAQQQSGLAQNPAAQVGALAQYLAQRSLFALAGDSVETEQDDQQRSEKLQARGRRQRRET